MAERFQPPPPSPPLASSSTAAHHQIPDDKATLQIVLPSSHETYVVQMPRDRIYRVPPPENAAYVERIRAPPSDKSPRCRFPPCVFYVASAFFALAILALFIFLIYKFTLCPKSPLFTITSFSVTQSPNPNPNPKSMYKVGIEATNPNSVNSLVYVAGNTELSLGGREVAGGRTPAITQPGKETDDLEVAMTGRDGTVPAAMGKNGVKMNLTMSLHVKKKTWLTNHNDLVVVKCEFVVESVSRQKDSKAIKSQRCDYS